MTEKEQNRKPNQSRFAACIKFLFACCLLTSSPTQSLYLEKMDTNALKNTKIAYYPGSFDPLHLGHTMVVETVLDKNLADYVLVYALPESDTSKKRTPHNFRFAMLESIYKEHPKVLITKLTPAEMQEKFRPLFKEIEFSVVQGSDVINQYVNDATYDNLWMKGLPIRETKPEHANTSLGAIMAIPATRVIAFKREGGDLSYLGKTYKNLPITILTPLSFAELSSTKARSAVQKKENLSGVVPPEVLTIIHENKLYSN